DVNQPVVAADPQEALLLRRLRDGEDGAEHLDAGVVAGDRPAAPLLLLLVVAGQILGDDFPGVPGVAGAEEDVGPVVDRLRVVLQDQDRGGPLEAVLHLRRVDATRVVLVDGDVAGLAGAVVVAGHDAAVLAGVDDVRVAGVGEDEPGLPAADSVPVAQMNAAGLERVARPAGAARVLQAGHDAVRGAGVGRDVVALRDGQRRRDPRLAPVGRDVHTAVVGADHPVGVL